MSYSKGIIQGKSEPFDQCFIGFECKINSSKNLAASGHFNIFRSFNIFETFHYWNECM